MRDDPLPQGLSAEEALGRLLNLMGKSNSRRRLDGESPESILVVLDAQRIAARVVRMRTDDLAFLTVPVLLRLADRTWLLLRAVSGGRVTLEGVDGEQEIAISSLPPDFASEGVQIVPELPQRATLWRRLMALSIRERAVLIHVGAASLILTILALIPPQLTRVVVDGALTRPTDAPAILNVIALTIVLVTLFQVWTTWLRSRAVVYLKTRTEMSLNVGFLAHLLALPFPFLNRNSPGQLMQSFTALSGAQSLLLDRCLGAALDAVIALAMFVNMLVMMPGPAVAVFMAGAAIGALVAFVSKRQAMLQSDETDAQVRQRDFLFELLSGAATVKVAGFESRGLLEWKLRLRAQATLSLQRQRTGLWSEVGADIVRQMLMISLLVWGAHIVLDGRATTGTLLAFLQMTSTFLASLSSIVGVYSSYVVLAPQLAFAREALAVEPPTEPALPQSSASTSVVVFEQVWFRYAPDAPWILRDLDLVVEKGEKRWIKGPSGIGKSTILRLASGLYSPERGRIGVAGCSPAAAQQQMIYLPQFVRLYGGSILENLRIFSAYAARERLMEASRASGLHALVATLPMGYETALPPGGGTLSGGERQLVALTAAMASDREIFLLDESLSNLDSASRRRITEGGWFADKTVIYVSHEIGWVDHRHETILPSQLTS